jgi:O-antigen/teichoic acid export membrane protein
MDIQNPKITPEPLSRRVVKGGLWVFALRIMNGVLGFIRTIILARLLAPEDFGILGIAMLSIATLERFSETGFQTALIQKEDNVESYLDTAWTVSAIRGTVLFCILFFSAPLIARFFNSSQATLVIRVIAISTLFSGLTNIGVTFFQKELEFNKQFFYQFSATIVDLSVAITLAFILRNVWALVWGGLAAHFVRLFMSYVLHPYRPRISFEKRKFKDLFGFGKWVLGSSILVFLVTQGDDIFVGKAVGVVALGLYQMAYTISNLPTTEITGVISQVTFPAYSKLQNDLPKLRTAYLDVLQVTAFLSILLGGMIFVLAPEFTQIFLGRKWMPIVPAMKVLAVCGVIRSIGSTTGPVFHGVGKPNILTKLVLIKLLALTILIYPLTTRYGIVGTSLAVLGASLISNPVADYKVIKVLGCRFLDFSKMIALPLLSVFITSVILVVLKSHFNIDNILEFCLALIGGFAIYLGTILLLGNPFGYKLKETLALAYTSVR